MQQTLDFMSTLTKPKQCETTVKQQTQTVRLGEQDIEEVTEFTYLGAKVEKDGNTEAEIKTIYIIINKARGAFAVLKNIWKTKKISKKTYTHCQEQSTVRTAICCRVVESD